MNRRTYIQWNPKYSVDLPTIDKQHQKWLEIFNNLNDAVINGLGKIFVKDALKEFFEYTQYHFSEEEKIFKENKYPKAEAHILMHTNMVWTITHLYYDFVKGENDTLLAVKTLGILKKWLTEHILVADKEYGDYIKLSKKKIDPAKKTTDIS